MSDYSVSIGNRQYQVRIGNNRLLLDNAEIPNNLIAINGSGLHLLRQKHRLVELHVKPAEGDTYEVLVNGKRIMVRVESGDRRNAPGLAKKDPAAAGDLRAPMPGLVVNISVQVGDTVEKGQVLVVLESMKMQMQMRSSVRGKVSYVAVQPAAQVEKGALLVKVEPENSGQGTASALQNQEL